MTRTSKPCRKCRKALTRCPSGYCDVCKPAEESNWTGWQKQRGNRHERGYGNDWDKLRLVILERDEGLCQICIKEDVITRATHIDHIVPKAKGGTNAHSNLQALCKRCHDRKTATERGQGGG